MLVPGITFWVYIGTFYLLILTYKDFKDNMLVDDRYNYFMMGVTISLLTHISRKLYFILIMLAIVISLNIFLNKHKIVGGADISTLTWLIYGYGIIGMSILIMFFITFSILTVLHYSLKTKVFNYRGNVPFYPVIIIAFVFVNIVFQLY